MSSKRSPPIKRPSVDAPKRGRVLDTLAHEAIERCSWILAKCGYSPEESARHFESSCKQIPSSVIQQGFAVNNRYDFPAHLLTLWSQDPQYLLPNGELRPLTARGPAPSIEALVRSLGAKLTIEDAIDGLMKSKALRKIRGKYAPRNSWVVAYPSNSDPQLAHHMQAFVEFLRTLEHNTRARNGSGRWFQYAALNPYLPAKQFAALNRYLRKTGIPFLKDKDAVMHRMSRDRKPREATIPVSIGVYLSGFPVPKARREAKTR